MATRIKTRELYFPVLTSVTNNTLTSFTTLTVQIPESSITFRSVTAELTCDDIITATGGSITTKLLDMRIGAGSYVTFNNASTLTHSGENLSLWFTYDVTSVFSSQWSGTSNTIDARIQINQSTGTTTGMRDAFIKLYITYEYDDASITHSKTVLIPLGCFTSSLSSTEALGATFQIPNLSTYCPEAHKQFDQVAIVFEGNDYCPANGTDFAMRMRVDSGVAFDTGLREAQLQSMRYYRYIYESASFDTSSTHSLQVWSPSVTGRFGPNQTYMSVDYRFIPTSSSRALNSILLPMEFSGHADAAISTTQRTLYLRGQRDFLIQEENVTTGNCAFVYCFQSNVVTSVIQLRANISGIFAPHTLFGSGFLCGGQSIMFRPYTDLILNRGRNYLYADIYGSGDTTPRYSNISGIWMLNYASDIASGGIDTHNKTIRIDIAAMQDNGAAAEFRYITGSRGYIPESDYFITSIGIHYKYITNSTGNPAGVSVSVADTSSLGFRWRAAYSDIAIDDAEVGLRQVYSPTRDIYKRFPSDADTDRLEITGSRDVRCIVSNGCTAFNHLDLLYTYHSIPYTVSGSITGFSGSVDLTLHRTSDGEALKRTSRSGDGYYEFSWYDNTEPVFVAATDGVNVGRTLDQYAL